MSRVLTAQMKQALIAGSTRFEVVTAAKPALQGPGEILLRTAVCGICSGDLMPWYLEKKIGSVLGHEVVGWAEEVGGDVRHIRRGDLVFVHHHAPCLECDACRRGQPVQCPTWRTSRLDPGGMAEWIRVPDINARSDCFAVNDLDDERAMFIEPLACSLKAVQTAIAASTSPYPLAAVVVGCGVMGLLNLAAAAALGVPELTAVEPDPHRRRLAREFGAQVALTDTEASQKKLQADFVIVGPGQPEVIVQALRYVRAGGILVLFTPTPTGMTTGLDLGEIYFREIRLIPSYSCGPDDTRLAYQFLSEGRIQPERLITHSFRLDDIQLAYDAARRGGEVLKVVIRFDEDGSHANA